MTSFSLKAPLRHQNSNSIARPLIFKISIFQNQLFSNSSIISADIQHPKFNIQNSTSKIQHPKFNIQASARPMHQNKSLPSARSINNGL
jgi:hypothetical protein